MITVFYCSPTYIETLGLDSTITEYYTLTNEEAKTLIDYYENVEAGEAVVYGTFTSILGIAIKNVFLNILDSVLMMEHIFYHQLS